MSSVGALRGLWERTKSSVDDKSLQKGIDGYLDVKKGVTRLTNSFSASPDSLHQVFVDGVAGLTMFSVMNSPEHPNLRKYAAYLLLSRLFDKAKSKGDGMAADDAELYASCAAMSLLMASSSLARTLGWGCIAPYTPQMAFGDGGREHVASSMAIFGAVMTTALPQGADGQGMGPQAVWAWLAHTCNHAPGPLTATAVSSVLAHSGDVLFGLYGRQMMKLCLLLDETLLPQWESGVCADDSTGCRRLASWLRSVRDAHWTPPPATGRNITPAGR
jgi:hypothetical protein